MTTTSDPTPPYDHTDALLTCLKVKMPQVPFESLKGSRPLRPDQQQRWRLNQVGVWREMCVKVLKGVLHPYLSDSDAPMPFNKDHRYLGLVQLSDDLMVAYRVYQLHPTHALGYMEYRLEDYHGYPTTGVHFSPLEDHGPNAWEILSIRRAQGRYWYNPKEPLFCIGQPLTQQNLRTLQPGVTLIPSTVK